MLVHYKKQNLLGVCGAGGANKLILKPGINEVSKELWDEAHTMTNGKPLYPYFHDLKEAGDIVEVTGKADKPAESDDFHDMPEKKAMAVAANTADYDLLKSWADKEKRKPVLAVLKSQMKKFEDA